MKSDATADDVYKPEWPYYQITFSSLAVVDDGECAPSPASLCRKTNSKISKSKWKVSNNHMVKKSNLKKHATDSMKKMTEQPDKEN